MCLFVHIRRRYNSRTIRHNCYRFNELRRCDHLSRVLMRIGASFPLVAVGRGLRLRAGYDGRRTATSGSSAPRSYRHKAVLSHAALTLRFSGGLRRPLQPVVMPLRSIHHADCWSCQSSGTSAGGFVQGCSTNASWNHSSRRFACSVTIN